jgi:flavin-dependent dehydrogenase
MKSELRELVRRLGHSPENYPLSGSRLVTDYPGHVFGNIFLVGDAAGLVEDWSGYGIYAAWASGWEAAQAILGLSTRFQLIASVLAAKRRQRRLIQAMTRSPAVGRAVFGLMPATLRVLPWARRLLRSSQSPAPNFP